MGIAFSADAAFRVCNRSGQTINLGQGVFYLSYSGQKIFESQGYRVIRDGACEEVSPYSTRRMWFRAFGETSGVWDGSYEKAAGRIFCVIPDDWYSFDERALPDIHTSETVCAMHRGKLKRHFEAKGESESSDYVIYLDKGEEAPTVKPPKKDPKPSPKPYPKPDRDPIPPDETKPQIATFGPND